MKRTKQLLVLLAASVMIFNSCTKEVETSALTLDETKNATLIVNFYAELDQTKNGLEKVPNETQAIIRIDNAEFNPSASGFWSQIVTIENGLVELQIPVTSIGVTVEILPLEFSYEQVQPYGSISQKIMKIYRFSGVASESGVKPNEIRTHQVTYNNITSFDDYEETVNLKFELKAEIDGTNTDSEFVPSGTTVTFYTDNWTATATAGSVGKVEITVPANEDIYAVFYSNKTVYNSIGDPVSKYYKYSTYIGNYSESLPMTLPIYFGNGVIWE